MPFVNLDGIRLFYRFEGQPGKPVLVCSHSIGTDHGMWTPQAADFLPHFQVLRCDTRGHGASDAPGGEYSIEVLARDVVGIANSLKIDRFAFCGLSLGGAIGQWLAIHAADRLTRLVLANTSPQFGPITDWDGRIKTVRQGGMAAIADLAISRFFSAGTIQHGNPYVGSIKSVLLGTDPAGYAGCCAALRDADFRQSLKQIRVPTLVIAGDHDVSTTWSGHGKVLATKIPEAQSVRLPAAHLSNLEQPRSFSAALLGFLSPKPEGDPLDAGFAVRRATLGDKHVDRAIASSDDFNHDFQALITRYAWGTVWTRPGLDARTRRLLVLTTMAALGRWEEFSMHVRAGLEHELEPCDLKEMLMQTAIYAGVPAANTGFHIAREVMDEITEEDDKSDSSNSK